MHNIEILDKVTLDNNKKYLVASKINYKNKNYFQLVNMNDVKDSMVCYQDNNELVEIKDEELISLLVPLFLKNFNDKLGKKE